MKPTNVLLVFPRFGARSFWGMRPVSALWGARCFAPPLGLITLAALLPKTWTVRLVDRNAEELSDADIDQADLVMTGGMLPQRVDTLQVIARVRARGRAVVVGGPDAMSSPDAYGHADYLVLGEAEAVLPAFLQAFAEGARGGVFTAEKFSADVAASPVPRFELLNFRHYLFVGVQFSRGCPFNCEFCDIIELFGRVPRTKTNDQMLAELQTLYDAGYRGHVDFVDDNLIGNKRNLKRFLPGLAAWQRERGYPFGFSTEASINLADDAELLDMMTAANFFAIFTGIESPDTETLIQTKKKQNTRRSLADSVHRIYAAGMFVIAGFIVGFDTEKEGVAAGMIDCIEATAIPVCMVGLLTALPNTQLSRRLEREGRLRPLVMPDDPGTGGDQCTSGLNFVTLRPRSAVLADYRSVLASVYRPEAYFERVRQVALRLRRPRLPVRLVPWLIARSLRALGRLCWAMTTADARVRSEFWKTVVFAARHNLGALENVLILTAFYLHLGPFARSVLQELDLQIVQERENADLASQRDAA